MRRLCALFLGLMVAGQGAAQSVEEVARAASAQLIAAGDMLEKASIASDRTAALTQTVRAYEGGLTAVRAGLRQVTLRERAILAEFEARRGRLSQLLGVLSTMERAPAPLLLLHPSGPIGTARSGQMISEITPALQAEAEVLRADLETLALLHDLQDEAMATLRAGLQGVQTARAQLARAVSDRTGLPKRFVSNDAAMAQLVQNADTLAGFADGLADLPAALSAPIVSSVTGALSLPVSGQRIRGFQEADAAGIRRPGWLMVTAPAALVTSPLEATIRYSGPLLDYGKVIILEPSQSILLIFAGMSEAYGKVGEIIPAGAPIGLMGGGAPSGEDFLTEVGQGGSGSRSETLYIEIRQGNTPVDPAGWFSQ